MLYNQKSLDLHREKKGKIEIRSKVSLETKEDLSIAYSPGVGAVSSAIGEDVSKSCDFTNRCNQVAIVSDGTAILGLGDLGPEAAMPVMEGKSIIFKEFADVDAIPLCIDTKDVEEIIKFCKQIQPSFGGINLEDISAPRCFEILDRLEKELDIPVFHDDQDGTAIVALAALINACKVSGKKFEDLKIVINGAGAAGIAAARLIMANGAKDIILLDSVGTIYEGREKLNETKEKISKISNLGKVAGGLAEAMVGSDVFIGLSKGGLVDVEMVKSMNAEPIILAMANPIPEIMPDLALEAGASVVGTGRSDFPNQVNNALVFPGLFRGLLDAKIKNITAEMKLAVAKALAGVLEPTKDMILPEAIDKSVAQVIAEAVKKFK